MAITPAMATRRFCPPDSANGDWFARLASPAQPTSMASRTRSSISLLRQSHVGRVRNAISRAIVSSKQLVLRVLEHQTHPETGFPRCICPFRSRWAGRPADTSPAVGLEQPVEMLDQSVDLPEPVWPITPSTLALFVSAGPHGRARCAQRGCLPRKRRSGPVFQESLTMGSPPIWIDVRGERRAALLAAMPDTAPGYPRIHRWKARRSARLRRPAG